MSRENQRQDRIVAYLLGALPEPEAERLDELSVTDRAFGEALAAAEHDLVDAYVRGELTGDALARFRSHYLASPRRREKESFARALYRHLGRRSVASRPAPGARVALWALAATVVTLAIGAGWLGYQNARLRQQFARLQEQRAAALQSESNRSAAQAAAAESELAHLREERDRLQSELQGVMVFPVALMPQLRSAGAPRTLGIPPETTHVAFRLVLGPGGYSPVRVDLLDGAGRRMLWRSNPAAPRADGAARVADVTIHAELLPPGRYLLRVTALPPSPDAGIVGDYPFQVVPD